ncbi:Lrp/AsnC family transcriptional regulator [Actinacidiphila sp. ITFR-21]|uniref:Lrp/AsnC family transcriptional regulator n=1 Tax=Actinacidiphila sp. ITFR-21 TaxID=3075199 RepID=UPI00288A2464|nr:Lrp/AsnC family transcriptional regulator [Streptomyces sp. ITFR-21]WNI15387.1 Lrp/AsnC family transcriptional regulator [Streptomyces sp. ITFR-21]
MIDALQIAPRISWSALGAALGITPATAARRWRHLTENGIAWVTVGPGMAQRNAQCLAYVEITCHPAHRMRVARELATHPPALNVELTSGRADILVTVAAADLTTMSHYLLEHLGQVEHVLTTRVWFATRLYAEGSVWRLGDLAPRAATLLDQRRDDRPARRPGDTPLALTDTLKTMLTHLSHDGRASYAELAERAGVSPTTARRQVEYLLASGVILPRADVAAAVCGWPVQAYLWANAPVDARVDSAQALSRLRQARLCATVAAESSLMLGTWLRTVEEVHRLELAMAAKLPQVQVVDRLIVLRTVKRMGRLLDEQGRAVGHVPVNFWDDLTEHGVLSIGSLPVPRGGRSGGRAAGRPGGRRSRAASRAGRRHRWARRPVPVLAARPGSRGRECRCTGCPAARRRTSP